MAKQKVRDFKFSTYNSAERALFDDGDYRGYYPSKDKVEKKLKELKEKEAVEKNILQDELEDRKYKLDEAKECIAQNADLYKAYQRNPDNTLLLLLGDAEYKNYKNNVIQTLHKEYEYLIREIQPVKPVSPNVTRNTLFSSSNGSNQEKPIINSLQASNPEWEDMNQPGGALTQNNQIRNN